MEKSTYKFSQFSYFRLQISQPMYFCETCQQPLCAECREITHRVLFLIKLFF